MRKIQDQTLASTRIDSQGEKLTKEFLQKYCDHVGSGRIPLHQEHDMSKPTAGYIENTRLLPDPEHHGEWRVIGDVFIEEGQVENVLGGFSISGVEMIRRSSSATAFIYLSFPHYNNVELITALTDDPDLSVGKWIKKAAAPIDWVIIASVVAFAITPIWDDVYKRKIAPRIDSLLAKYLGTFQDKGLSVELTQIVLFKGNEVEVRIIPTKNNQSTCLQSEYVLDGLRKVTEFLNTDLKANDVGVKRIIIFYNDGVAAFELHRVEYGDGHVEHLV
jgi:hypothetical protein